MSNEITVTVRGWLATSPTLIVGSRGTEMARFRLASTPRRWDSASSSWQNGRTEWFSVLVRSQTAARNVAMSLRKGDPVMVNGQLSSSEWQREDGTMAYGMDLAAYSVGPDLTFGAATFARTQHEASTTGQDGENSNAEEFAAGTKSEDEAAASAAQEPVLAAAGDGTGGEPPF